MRIYRIAFNSDSVYRGYKTVGITEDGRGYSLYAGEGHPINLEIGSVVEDSRGFYLGTKPEFALDYYSGLTDGPEALLTYEFLGSDVLGGDPESETHMGDEVRVSRAKLVDKRLIDE